MTGYDTFKEFSQAVNESLPEEWDTQFDEMHIRNTDGQQAGFRRDDLMSFILEIPYDEEWPSDKLRAHVPNHVAAIPDRPGQPLYTIEPVTIENTVQTVVENAPAYEGTFEYDDDEDL